MTFDGVGPRAEDRGVVIKDLPELWFVVSLQLLALLVWFNPE